MAFDQSNIDDLLNDAGLGGGEGEAAPAEGAAEGAAAEGGTASVDDMLGAAAATTSGQSDLSGATAPNFGSFDSTPAASGQEGDIQNLLGDVDLRVQIVLGGAKKSIEEILALKSGDVVELDKLAGDPLDILVNDRLVAKGEVLVLNENFCIRITDIIPPDDRS